MIILVLILMVFGWFASATVESTASVEHSVAHAVTANEALAPFEVDDRPVDGFAVDSVSGEAAYAIAGESIYRSANGGWLETGTTPGLPELVVDSRMPNRLWAGGELDCYRGEAEPWSLMRSDDAGATWSDTGAGTLAPLASWEPGGIVIAHDCAGLQVSGDSGATWAMPDGLPLGSQVTSFAVLSVPESAEGLVILIGVTGEGGTSELYRVDLSGPEPDASAPLLTYYAIAPIGVDAEGAVYIGAPQGVLHSDDRGETWTLIRDGLESTTLDADPVEEFPVDLEPGTFGLTAMATPGDAVVVAGVDGVYLLNSDNGTWNLMASTDVEVRGMAVNPNADELLLLGDDGGVWRLSMGSN